MTTECYRVELPDRVRLAGRTLAGQRTTIVPGEHVVHRVRPRVPLAGVRDALRFLGADAWGRDVYLPVPPGADVNALLTGHGFRLVSDHGATFPGAARHRRVPRPGASRHV